MRSQTLPTSKTRSKRKENSPPRSPAISWYRNQSLWLGAILVLATILVYYPVQSHPFANYDDPGYVTQNPHIQSGLEWQTVAWAFTTYQEANWHPLTWLSHALDYDLFQLDPAGHHTTNLLLHTSNALLLFLVLLCATGARGPSFMVAALFALHPINVESVAWVAERKNLLSMFFFLLALGAYHGYARQRRIGRIAVVGLLFALGLMAKPQIITLPFVLLLWDYWPLQRMAVNEQNSAADVTGLRRKSFAALVTEKVPLFAIAAASAIVTVVAQRSGGAVTSLVQHPFSARVGNAIVGYAKYLGFAFWPSRLSVLYPYPRSAAPAWQVIVALLLLLMVTVVVLRQRRRRYLLVGWLWFLGTLVPMIGLVQVGSQAMADRYAYLPFIGLFLMVCWTIADWATRRDLPKVILPILSVIVLLLLSVVTHRQLNYWNDNVALWSHAIEVTRNNYIAEDNLGAAFLERGELEQAMGHFEKAAAIEPSDPTSLLKIAMYEQQRKNWPAAVQGYSRLLDVTSNPLLKARALTNLGYVYLDESDLEHARSTWQEASALDPQSARAWIGLGIAAQHSGDLNLSIKNYSHAIELEPSDVGNLLLAQALQLAGRKQEADAAMQHAKLSSKNYSEAQRIAADLLAH